MRGSFEHLQGLAFICFTSFAYSFHYAQRFTVLLGFRTFRKVALSRILAQYFPA